MAQAIKVKTIRIRQSTADRVAQLAIDLEAYESPLIDVLLCRVLDEIDAGRMMIRKKPIKYAIELS